MARVLWKGSIAFGLVNIPVRLHTALRDRSVHLHLLTPDGECRLHRKLYCPETGREYDFQDTARGYEVAPGQYVVLEEAELDAIRPEAGHVIDIQDFVRLDDIDPLFFDRPYYVLPDAAGARAYRLLVEALKRTGRVGIARFTMRRKQHLAAVRAVGDAIYLETMHHADEVVPLEDIEPELDTSDVDPKQLGVAVGLIEALSVGFEPERYPDEYRRELQALIERKAAHETIPIQPPPAEQPGRVLDLMSALERSLEQVEKARVTPPKTRKPPERKRKSA